MMTDGGIGREPAPISIAVLSQLWQAAQAWRQLAGERDESPWGPCTWKILDLRPLPEFLAGHLPGAVSLPRDEWEARIYELPPKECALVVCAADPSAAAACAGALRARGWFASLSLGEALAAWPWPWERGRSQQPLWEPSPLVQRWAARIPAGPVLDLGCGAGRDAVHLALRGHPVVAVDHLPDALEMARALAARHGVELHLHRADLRRGAPPPPPPENEVAGAPLADEPAATGPVDGSPSAPPGASPGYAAILMVRFLARGLADWIPGALRLHGLFLLEAYQAGPGDGALAPAGAEGASARPGTAKRAIPPPHARLLPGEALRLFGARLELLFYDEEGTGASGEAMVRLVMRRAAEGPWSHGSGPAIRDGMSQEFRVQGVIR
jgi:SAM-dependent methyltransferase